LKATAAGSGSWTVRGFAISLNQEGASEHTGQRAPYVI